MIIGVPRETKQHECRVGMLPVGIAELARTGHRVLVQRGAGAASGIEDAHYERRGATLLDDPGKIYAQADLIVKVKGLSERR